MALITKENLKNVIVIKQVKNFSAKFGINEPVFVLHDNKIQKGIVRQIDCTFKDGVPELETTILYTLELSELKKTVQLPEELCFGSKKALKDSL
jgi:hypothetical protein